MNVLTINCGSSSLKARLIKIDEARAEEIARGVVSGMGAGEQARVEFGPAGGAPVESAEAIADYGAALARLLAIAGGRTVASVDAVGHRVVHGGPLRAPALIDDVVISRIEQAHVFAPLHNGPSLEGIRAARAALPRIPMVAVFDTAFHATMPDVAARYAVSEELHVRYGVRRFGFHGIAHRSLCERYAASVGASPRDLSLITLQLGNGCSAAAIRDGACVDTSMGFTPLEGLVMGTRSGDLDPAAVTYLVRLARMSPQEVDERLNRQSGLIGLSGTTSDMAMLLEQEAAGDERARLAIEMFCYRVRKQIGAYLAALGDVRAVVFGGGIGERAPDIRRRICAPLAPLGIRIDETRNAALRDADGRFSEDGSPIEAWVVVTDEEAIIASDTYRVLSSDAAPGNLIGG